MVAEISQGAEMTAGVCQQAAVSAERERKSEREREDIHSVTDSYHTNIPWVLATQKECEGRKTRTVGGGEEEEIDRWMDG